MTQRRKSVGAATARPLTEAVAHHLARPASVCVARRGRVARCPYARGVSDRAIRRRLIVVLLGLGVVAPILYFGAQLVCGLLTDGYSFAREAASDLGTSDRPYHRVFNVAAFATGCSLICGGIGLLLVCMRPIPRRVATVARSTGTVRGPFLK